MTRHLTKLACGGPLGECYNALRWWVLVSNNTLPFLHLYCCVRVIWSSGLAMMDSYKLPALSICGSPTMVLVTKLPLGIGARLVGDRMSSELL